MTDDFGRKSTDEKLRDWCNAFNAAITETGVRAVPYRDLHSDMIRVAWNDHTMALYFDTDDALLAAYTTDAVITTARKYALLA